MPEVITDNLDLWTSALLTKSTAGRGSNGKLEAYGIKKLRELILELAINGRLLGNDTSGWAETKLGEIGEWGSGGTPLKTHAEYYGGDIPWLVIGDLNDGLVTNAQTHITQLGLEKSSAQLVAAGTLLIAMYGSIGKLGIAGIPCATNQAIAFCSPDSEKVETAYLFLYLRAIRGHLLSRGQGLAQQNISQKILKATSIKLPVLEEQRRIVAKVDELMALCDQLEQQQTHSLEAHQTLVVSLLGTLTRVESQQEFSAAWARIVNHFDTLFTTEASIDQLKQTILQLAVMGKLVPQDPNDEPASVLLAKIAAENERLAKEGEIKKQKPLPPIKPDELPYELPPSWVWARLPDIAFFQEGPGIMAKDFRDAGIPLIRIAGMHNDFVSLEGCNFLDEDMVEKKWAHFRLELGDIVLSSSASLGIVAKVGEGTVGSIVYTGLIRFQPFSCLYDDFFIWFLNSNEFISQINKSKTGAAIMHFGPTHLKGMLVPLAPLAEQHRIVAKVDELMAMCDALKAHLADAQAIQHHLADAIVEQAVA
jgi:type I restriction enzyme S subunit